MMADASWTQIGVGGTLAYVIIREVLGFLKHRRENNGGGSKGAGEYPVEYWQAEQRKAVSEMIVLHVVPILANQTVILSELRSANVGMEQKMAVILDRLTDRR
jgi:hypothetical protein